MGVRPFDGRWQIAEFPLSPGGRDNNPPAVFSVYQTIIAMPFCHQVFPP
jgi:hypothetical protein